MNKELILNNLLQSSPIWLSVVLTVVCLAAWGWHMVRARVRAEAEAKFQQELASQKEKYIDQLSVSLESNLLTLRAANHNMMGPLTVILGFLPLLEEIEGLDNQQKRALKHIKSKAHHLLRTIEDLRTYVKAQHEGVGEFTEFDIFTCFNDVADGLKLTEGQSLFLPSRIVNVVADKTLIKLMIEILVSNAFKYESKNIHVTYEDHKDEILISVTDDGIGIDEKYLERIFQPFERLHYQNEYPGTGMGLALARSIMRMHKGSIVAKQNNNLKGVTFEFKLPKGRKRIS